MSRVQYMTITTPALWRRPKQKPQRPLKTLQAVRRLHHPQDDILSRLTALHTPQLTCRFGRFGQFGGQYAPESLMDALCGLEAAFWAATLDEGFWQAFRAEYAFLGRPGHLHRAARLTAAVGGATIWLKREDLNHTGSHTITSAMGQVLLARRLGRTRIVTETGGGQHGVATAAVCAHFGMACEVYMGERDFSAHPAAVDQMRLLGAAVIPVASGTQSVRDAASAALRTLVEHLDTTHYVVSSAVGPHPFPTIVRTLQTVLGYETRAQMDTLCHKQPDALVACIGGGGHAAGLFAPFVADPVRLLAVEAAGAGLMTGQHGATLTAGAVGVFQGAQTYVLQDGNGQIRTAHSAAAGLRYPAVSPELAAWKESGRLEVVTATDEQAAAAGRQLAQLEGIVPALEAAHAVYGGMWLAGQMRPGQDVVVCVSGRG